MNFILFLKCRKVFIDWNEVNACLLIVKIEVSWEKVFFTSLVGLVTIQTGMLSKLLLQMQLKQILIKEDNEFLHYILQIFSKYILFKL